MSIMKKNFYEIIKITPFLGAFLSFVVLGFFPLLYPELNDITDSNLWPMIILIFSTLMRGWFIILLPGLGLLFVISLFETLKKLFLSKDIEDKFELTNRCFSFPVLIFCLSITLSKYYLHLNFKALLLLVVVLCLFNTFIAYCFISRKSFSRYVTHKAFFLEKGGVLLFALYICYLYLAAFVTGLAIFLEKCAPLILKSTIFQECLSFGLILILFALPSKFLLMAYANKSNQSKYWLINCIFTVIVLFFIYTDWYVHTVKPQLKKHHYAFFNDITYYFDQKSCTILKENKVSLKQLNEQFCFIVDDFETTSAIGSNLILTFNNKIRIILPKPKYYSQSIKNEDKQKA